MGNKPMKLATRTRMRTIFFTRKEVTQQPSCPSWLWTIIRTISGDKSCIKAGFKVPRLQSFNAGLPKS